MKQRLLILIVSLVVTFGCAVGPDYEPPPLEQKVPDAWKSAAGEETEAVGSQLETWWTTPNDPKLVELIHEARANNLVLQVTMLGSEPERVPGKAQPQATPRTKTPLAQENRFPTRLLGCRLLFLQPDQLPGPSGQDD